MTLALALAMGRGAAADPGASLRPPSARLGLDASSADGLEASARINAGGAEVRLWAAWAAAPAAGGGPAAASEGGLAMSLANLRCGTTRPAGLAAFVYAPSAAESSLTGASGAPLALDGPDDAEYLGASVGEDFGFFTLVPTVSAGLCDLGTPAWGAWLSPRGGFFSTLAMVAGEAAAPGGPGWYDVPSPRATRAFCALSARSGGAFWSAAAAVAGSAGFPGRDAAACRAEARAALGGFRLEATLSAASGVWHAPDGAPAPFLTLVGAVRYARLGYAANLGYRYVMASPPGTDGAGADGAGTGGAETGSVDSDGDESGGDEAAELGTTKWSASAEARGRLGRLRVAASLSEGLAMELDTRLQPGFAPWLSLGTSWKAAGGEATSFDLTASADSGKRVRFGTGAGLRFEPEGHSVKGSVSLARTVGCFSVACSVRTSGWVAVDGFQPSCIEYTIHVVATLE